MLSIVIQSIGILIMLLVLCWVLSGLVNSWLWTGNPFSSEEKQKENATKFVKGIFKEKED